MTTNEHNPENRANDQVKDNENNLDIVLKLQSLPKCFGTKEDFLFTQLKETSQAFIYKVTSGNGNVTFEAFKSFRDNLFACENYPTPADFNKRAWEFTTFSSALKKFNELNQ